MRPPSEVLSRARAHVAAGWVPTVSRDAAGEMCGDEDEGITRVCILDACLMAAPGRDLVVMHRAMRSLALLIPPPYQPTEWERAQGMQPITGLLGDWEAEPTRTQGDVLELFNRARRIALAKESR